jgi:hypothetical protein
MTTPNPTPESGLPSPGPAGSASAGSGSAGFPPAPWILLDRTTAAQAATVLDRIARWLAGAGEPAAVAACAAACSLGEDDELSVAAWLDALAARLDHRIAETDAWEAGSWS